MSNLLLRGALILLLLPAIVNTESHWESYADHAMVYIRSCYPYYYTYCSDWYSYPYYLGYNSCTCSRYQPYSSVCYQATGLNCYTNNIGQILVIRWRCQYGWQGANCDIPICNNPVCTVDQICLKPFTCDCPRSLTGECVYEPCDDGPNNCYPGFCNKTRSPWKCTCPAGFTGPNCQTVTNAPEIKSCYVQIFGTPDGQREQEVARANECAAPGLDPLPVWIGQRAANQLTKIVVSWEAQYVNQVPLPGRGRAPYILGAPVQIGIVKTNFTVSFPDQTRFTPQSTFCIGPDPVYDLPPAIKQCNGILKQWTDLGVSNIIKSNVSFLVTIEAQVGGVKKGDNYWSGGRFTTAQRFSMDPNMNTTTRLTKFAFDLEPPYHCLTRSNCSVFPIYLNRTMSSNPIIQPTFNGWNDDGSGIDRFYVEVYYMQPDAQNLLVPTGAALRAENVNITLNNFQFTCQKPGAYSIVLTVYDKANNSAMARKIFNYDNHESSFYETASPIRLSAADPNTDYRFITRLARPADGTTPYKFNVIWEGHFANSNKEDWLRGVRPWPLASNVIDDSYGSKFGLRSIDSLTMETGVSGYELAYSVDNRTGGVGAVAPSTFTVITDRSRTSFTVSIPASLKDGDTIIVWLKVYDLYGNSVMIVSKTHVDTSRFNIVIGTQLFTKHFPDQFNSSVVIDAVNRISGIKNITYEIYDKTKQLSVRTGTALPVVLEAPSALGSLMRSTVSRPCLSTDPTCYCIPLGNCYNRTQLINIDNCWIDRVAGDEVLVKYTVYSLAGWGLSGEVNAGTFSKEDIPCRPPTLPTIDDPAEQMVQFDDFPRIFVLLKGIRIRQLKTDREHPDSVRLEIDLVLGSSEKEGFNDSLNRTSTISTSRP